MSVRAKFRFDSYTTRLHTTYPHTVDVTGHPDYDRPEKREMRTLHFSPVSDGSEENKRFWDATPCGEIKLGTVNPEAWEQFELGREYYLDFTPAE